MALRFLQRVFRGKQSPSSNPSSKPPSLPSPPKSAGVDFGWPSADPDDSPRDRGGSDYLQDFLYNGMVLFVDSSWTEYGRWHRDREELEIGFKDGHVAFYGDCDEETARSFAEAPSKGKWLWANCHASFAGDGRHWNHSRPYRHK